MDFVLVTSWMCTLYPLNIAHQARYVVFCCGLVNVPSKTLGMYNHRHWVYKASVTMAAMLREDTWVNNPCYQSKAVKLNKIPPPKKKTLRRIFCCSINQGKPLPATFIWWHQMNLLLSSRQPLSFMFYIEWSRVCFMMTRRIDTGTLYRKCLREKTNREWNTLAAGHVDYDRNIAQTHHYTMWISTPMDPNVTIK